jgi:hypothetical protein
MSMVIGREKTEPTLLPLPLDLDLLLQLLILIAYLITMFNLPLSSSRSASTFLARSFSRSRVSLASGQVRVLLPCLRAAPVFER